MKKYKSRKFKMSKRLILCYCKRSEVRLTSLLKISKSRKQFMMSSILQKKTKLTILSIFFTQDMNFVRFLEKLRKP